MKKFVLSSALTALFLLSGCCSHPGAIQSLDRTIAANKGHMADEGLPQEARDIAQDNYDAANQVKFNLDGTELPADTAQREAARAADADAAATDAAATDRDGE
jgi:hypothetical protein